MNPTNIASDDEPMSRAEALGMQGLGFELTNDELEAMSDIELARD